MPLPFFNLQDFLMHFPKRYSPPLLVPPFFIGKPQPGVDSAAKDFTNILQLVAVFHMGYCGNDYGINGKNNLLLWSEDLTQVGSWGRNPATIITPNATLDPDGNLTADRVHNAGFGGGGEDIYQTITPGGGAVGNRTFTASFYIKVDEDATMQLFVSDGVSESNPVSPIRVRKSQGWTRIYTTYTFAGGNVNTQVRLLLRLPGSVRYVYAWGAQLVEYDRPMRYQKTTTAVAETSTCTAVDAGDGARCYFAFQGNCQDLPHFDGEQLTPRSPRATIRKWAFSLKHGYAIPSDHFSGSIDMVRPYLMSAEYLAQRIEPSKSVTESSRITLRFHDDFNPGMFDNSKPLANTDGSGSFWKLWVRRYRNFPFRRVELWLVPMGGTIEDEETSYRLFTGIIEDINFNQDGTVGVVCKDLLKKLRDRVPAAISADNVLVNGIGASGGTGVVIDVVRASEFTDPNSLVALSGATASKVSIRIGDASPEKDELFIVTARDVVNNRLTVNRAAYGSTPQAHLAGAQIREVIVYRSSTAPYTGFNPADIEFDLITRAGLSVNDIDQAKFISDRDTWLTGMTMSRIVEEPEDVEGMLREIKQLMFSGIWVNEQQKITHVLMAPANLTTSNPPMLTDEAHFIHGTLQYEVRDPERINRVILFYDPVDFESGTEDIKSFKKVIYVEDINATDPRNYGKTAPPLRVYSKWFSNGSSAAPTASNDIAAAFFAKKVGTVNRNALARFTVDMDFKDASLQVGDPFVIGSRFFVDLYNQREPVEMFIIEKKRVNLSRFRYTVLSMRDKPKYGLIAPPGTPNYPDASDDARRRFAFIGNKSNRLNNGAVEGVLSW